MKNVPDEAYRKYKDFEDFIFQLFKVVGYEVKIDNTKKKKLVYNQQNQNERDLFEIKFSSKKNISAIAFSNGINKLSNSIGNEKKLLIFNALCPSGYQKEENNNIEIIDLRNILYLTNCDNKLHKKLLGFLDFL